MTDVLKAGGIAPLGTKRDDEALDTVVAREYAHPVLPGRVVVRLSPESVVLGQT